MRKFLVLIAGGLVAYGLVGAAASSLTVTQSTVPAQGVSTDTLGACTDEVSVKYVYQNAAGDAEVTLESGEAKYVSAIVVTAAAGNLCDDGSGSEAGLTDFAAILPEALDTQMPAPPETAAEIILANSSVAYMATGDWPFTTVAAPDGGWVFTLNQTAEQPALDIADFYPGAITVTLWRDVPPEEPPALP